MATETLTDARIRALTPRRFARDIRDAKLKGFGVRVLPSGRKRYFVHCQHESQRVWRIVGGADEIGAGEARSRAAAMLAEIRQDGPMPVVPEDTVFEAVAEAAFRRHERLWKPRTLKVNRGYLRCQILPRFAGRQVAEITRQDVVRWFASLAATPVAADRSMPVLSVIMREAERMGLRAEGSNPCHGIRRYRRKGRERFLSDAEIRALARCLDAREDEHPLAVAVVRLLLLTGCRKSEILTLRWADRREGALFLRDSKTGPRTVWLSRVAQDVLDGIDRNSVWVFPSRKGDGSRSTAWLDHVWRSMRTEANLGDVRLHDLRHNYASHAVMNGVPVPVVSRLLGHTSVRMTLRYIHMDDREVRAAAERIGEAMAKLMAGTSV